MSRSSIPEVREAARIYKVPHFRYPIDVVNHENRLEDKGWFENAGDRMTCRHCKTFHTSDHIEDHHANRANQGELFS
jgi:hypothetical protein